jgi:signal transduction histidine kinase/ActR/RegA family two-component response regulator
VIGKARTHNPVNWANLPLRWKGVVVVAIPLVALLAAATSFFINDKYVVQTEEQVTHTYEVRAAIALASAALLDAETGMRGYLLTGQEAFLAPYEKAIETVPTALAQLDRVLQDSPAQVQRMQQITSLAEQKLDDLTALRYAGHAGGALTSRQQELLRTGSELTDALQRQFTEMNAEENRLLSLREALDERVHRRLVDTMALSVVLGLPLGLLAVMLFVAGIAGRVQLLSESAKQLAEGGPLSALPLGNDEIGRLGHALIRSSALLRERERGLREAQADADRANRAKTEFLSRMSHELRTPMNAILGFAQLMEMDSLTPEHRESVEHILKGGRHLLELINEVLDIARVEAGRLTLSPEPVQVSDVVREALELIGPLADRRHLRMHGEARTCDWYVIADRQRLKQVLLNLLSNAVKYNREGGTLTVSCEGSRPGRVRLKVNDTGLGISAEEIDRLFVPFERLGAAQTGVEGTGLGLALCKRLIEAMGGALGVKSTVGQGSTFWVDLAQAEDPREQLKQIEMNAPVPAGLTASTHAGVVLYIEDNLPNLELIQRLLMHRPEVRVLPAMQGGLGLDLAREHRPDLVLLDLHLPDITGEEVLRRLRGASETSHIPVVVISADATPGQIKRLLSAGANAYLTKPLDVKRLFTLLDEILAKRQLGDLGNVS